MNSRSSTLAVAVALGLGTLCPVANAQLFDQSQGPFGTTSGTPFDQVVAAGWHIDRVEVAHAVTVSGLRFQSSDVMRTTTAISPWLGTSFGNVDAFQISPGDYLESIDLWHSTLGDVYTITLRSRAGNTASYGLPQTSAPDASLYLSGHEIAGFHGSASVLQLASLGAHLRPAWETTAGPVDPGGVGNGEAVVVDLGTHIAEMQMRLSPTEELARISYHMRDDQGRLAGWTPEHGGARSVYSELGAVPHDDYFESMVVHTLGANIVGLELVTRQGLLLFGGTSGDGSTTLTTSPGHEIVGHFGVPSSATQPHFTSLGLVQRPLAARSWQIRQGCAGSSGQVPSLTLEPPRVATGMSVTIAGTPGTFGAVFLDPQVVSIPLGACSLGVNPGGNIPFILPASGTFDWRTVFGTSAGHFGWNWVGLQMSAQALVVDSSEFSVSEARTMIFGGI
ncbi:MAG: jacalin-like lectin [Planctomycetota bacterium]